MQTTALAAGAAAVRSQSSMAAEPENGGLHLASNQYSWLTFYKRDGRDFFSDLGANLADLKTCALDGYEPIINNPDDVDTLVPLLRKQGLEMRSIYVNSTMHEPDEAEKSIASILAIAGPLKMAGAKIVVTNPNPIRWGGPENKDDRQLEVQADALERLGKELRKFGLTLAYHNHDVELRNAAREFHHMMVGTDPKYVTLCLDAHWIYRASGNSQTALFDIVELYGKRITEVHLRQSRDGVWTETFSKGDIDYERLAKALHDKGVRPHLVLEQAPETGTPKTMGPVELHQISAKEARRIFHEFAR